MIAKEMEYNATLGKQLTPDAIRFGLKILMYKLEIFSIIKHDLQK